MVTRKRKFSDAFRFDFWRTRSAPVLGLAVTILWANPAIAGNQSPSIESRGVARTASGHLYRLEEKALQEVLPMNDTSPLISLSDAVSLTKFSNVKLSPSGRWLVYQTTRGDLQKDRYDVSTWMMDLGGDRRSFAVARQGSIVDFQWATHRDVLYVVVRSAGESRLERYEPEPRSWRALLTLASDAADNPGISGVSISADERRVAVIEAEPVLDSWDKAPVRVFDEPPMVNMFLSRRFGFALPDTMAMYSLEGRLEGRWRFDGGVFGVAWSPKSDQVIVRHADSSRREATNNSAISLLDLKDGRPRRLDSGTGAVEHPVWLSDTEFVFAFAERPESTHPFFFNSEKSQFYIFNIPSGVSVARPEIPPGVGSRDYVRMIGNELYFDHRSDSRLVSYRRFDMRTGEMSYAVPESRGMAKSFAPSADGKRVAYVMEDLHDPPELYLYDRDRIPERLTSENAHLARRKIYRGVDFSWYSDGEWTQGYLFTPTVAAGPEKPSPLAVIGYGFNRGFTTWAQYLAHYPVQWFVDRGIAVLLWNAPPFDSWEYGDFDGAYEQEIMRPYRSIMAATDILIELGIADPNRLGLMGHSMGGQYTGAAIVRTDRFRAASIHEPSVRNVTTYWTHGARWQYLMNGIFGGPPLGASFERYEKFLPELARPSPRTPVLLEASTNWFQIVEQQSAWQAGGTPVELILYADEAHVLTKPTNQISSAELNLDWFSFWLLDQEDPAPDKAERYVRWRQMKERRSHPNTSRN